MMWRRDEGIELSWIDVDVQGNRCSTIIHGFRDGDGGEGLTAAWKNSPACVSPQKICRWGEEEDSSEEEIPNKIVI